MMIATIGLKTVLLEFPIDIFFFQLENMKYLDREMSIYFDLEHSLKKII